MAIISLIGAVRRIRRLAPALCALVACLTYLAVVASAAQSGEGAETGQAGQGSGEKTGGSPSSSSVASATLEQCLTAVAGTGRSATFDGQMNAVAGTNRMAMQIILEEQSPGETTFHSLAAAAPGGWRRSEAGVKIYKYVRQVTDLPAPAAFRAVVQFRWMNEKGRVIKRAARHTPVCVQPDQRPKLVVAQVRVTPVRGTPQADYQVVVRNDGHSAAGAFGVALSVGGTVQPLLSVTALDPGARTALEAEAPRCAPGSKVAVQLDPKHQVEEALGGGQSDTLPCPLTGAGSAASEPATESL